MWTCLRSAGRTQREREDKGPPTDHSTFICSYMELHGGFATLTEFNFNVTLVATARHYLRQSEVRACVRACSSSLKVFVF